MEEYNKFKKDRCLLCGLTYGLDIAHVKTQKAFAHLKYESWNCPTLCRMHHSEQHNTGINSFAKKYSKYKTWLILNDWEFCQFTNKFYHEGLHV